MQAYPGVQSIGYGIMGTDRISYGWSERKNGMDAGGKGPVCYPRRTIGK